MEEEDTFDENEEKRISAAISRRARRYSVRSSANNTDMAQFSIAMRRLSYLFDPFYVTAPGGVPYQLQIKNSEQEKSLDGNTLIVVNQAAQSARKSPLEHVTATPVGDTFIILSLSQDEKMFLEAASAEERQNIVQKLSEKSSNIETASNIEIKTVKNKWEPASLQISRTQLQIKIDNVSEEIDLRRVQIIIDEKDEIGLHSEDFAVKIRVKVGFFRDPQKRTELIVSKLRRGQKFFQRSLEAISELIQAELNAVNALKSQSESVHKLISSQEIMLRRVSALNAHILHEISEENEDVEKCRAIEHANLSNRISRVSSKKLPNGSSSTTHISELNFVFPKAVEKVLKRDSYQNRKSLSNSQNELKIIDNKTSTKSALLTMPTPPPPPPPPPPPLKGSPESLLKSPKPNVRPSSYTGPELKPIRWKIIETPPSDGSTQKFLLSELNNEEKALLVSLFAKPSAEHNARSKTPARPIQQTQVSRGLQLSMNQRNNLEMFISKFDVNEKNYHKVLLKYFELDSEDQENFLKMISTFLPKEDQLQLFASQVLTPMMPNKKRKNSMLILQKICQIPKFRQYYEVLAILYRLSDDGPTNQEQILKTTEVCYELHRNIDALSSVIQTAIQMGNFLNEGFYRTTEGNAIAIDLPTTLYKFLENRDFMKALIIISSRRKIRLKNLVAHENLISDNLKFLIHEESSFSTNERTGYCNGQSLEVLRYPVDGNVVQIGKIQNMIDERENSHDFEKTFFKRVDQQLQLIIQTNAITLKNWATLEESFREILIILSQPKETDPRKLFTSLDSFLKATSLQYKQSATSMGTSVTKL